MLLYDYVRNDQDDDDDSEKNLTVSQTGKPVFFSLKTGYLWRFKIAGSPQTNEDTEDQTESRRLPESMLKTLIFVIASVIFKKS